ncbi:MAG TPA: T9SS type A sorting domain-containing protein [Ignavibacteria bacterium]
MKKIKIIIIVLLLAISSISYGMDTTSMKYMPLQVGNYWVYNYHVWSLGYSQWYIVQCSVLGSIIYNNHKYYSLYSSSSELFNGYFRVDSITGSLYLYDANNSCAYYFYEKLYDSLSAINGDSIQNCAYSAYKCIGTTPVILFGDTTSKVRFYVTASGINWSESGTKSYVKKYGFYSLNSSGYGGGGTGGISYTLKGCKINGIIYGDTSLTSSINRISSSVPASYFLSQNYPNPFNPVTKIRFDVSGHPPYPPSKGEIKISLKVYDLLGKEITTLVNEQLQPGSYEVTFDGSNLPSGIYFYQLRAGDYVETKKMLIIK